MKSCLIITGAVCVLGCAFLSIFNVIEAYYSKAEVIPKSEYNVGIVISDGGDSSLDAASSRTEETININSATASQLAEFLPGIGEKKAASIVEYRKLVGRFVSVDELLEVDGIGEKTLENIRPYCRLSD